MSHNPMGLHGLLWDTSTFCVSLSSFYGPWHLFIYLFRNFPCIHSFPQPKDIIVSLGLLAYTVKPLHRSRIRHSVSMVPERILFQLWFPHLSFSRIHCFFFKPPPTKTMNRGFTVYVFVMGGEPAHRTNLGDQDFLSGLSLLAFGVPTPLLQGNKICNPRQGPLQSAISRSQPNSGFFFEVVTPPPSTFLNWAWDRLWRSSLTPKCLKWMH
jgi:hypothetical protein